MSEHKCLVRCLKEGISYERYGLFAGEPDVSQAEYLMDEAADTIVSLEEENLKLRQKLNKRQKFINYLVKNWLPVSLFFVRLEWELKE